MIQLFTELQEKKNVRSNLSALRASLKEATEEQKAQAIEFVRGHEDLVFGFLQEEDAKTRKNAALLLGDLAVQNALQPLWKRNFCDRHRHRYRKNICYRIDRKKTGRCRNPYRVL